MKYLKAFILFPIILAGVISANFLFAAEKIDVNTASSEDLVKIIHIGEVRALELISLRPFSSLDDLARIKGIGEKRIEDIKNQGLAWVGTSEIIEAEPPPVEVPTEPEIAPTLAEKTTGIESPQKSLLSIVYPNGVVINELLPSPIGADEAEEWIEISNQNNFEVDISNWKISDVSGKTEVYIFAENTVINPSDFILLPRPTTKITLNNQGDGLRLVQPDGNTTDEISYENAPRGESYGRFGSDWAWVATPTPGNSNILPASVPEPLPQIELAAVAEQIPKNSANSLLFFAAAFTSLASGGIILLLKKKLKLS